MVVQYREVKVPLAELPFHGVLLAGLACGNTDSDAAAEQFLRAAEPPGHDGWVHGTDRLRAEYKPGAQSRLAELWREVEASVRDVLSETSAASTEGPRKLRELLPLVGSGPPRPVPGLRLDRVRGRFSRKDKLWTIFGRVRRSALHTGRWKFSIKIWLDAETGRGEDLEIKSLKVERGSARREGAVWKVEAVSGAHEVAFKARAVGPEEITSEDMSRIRIRVHTVPLEE
jgi:hypothetical protein